MPITNTLDNILINSSAFYLNAVTKFLLIEDNNYSAIIKPIFIGDNESTQQEKIQEAFENFTLSDAGYIVVNNFLGVSYPNIDKPRLLNTWLCILCSNPYLLDLAKDKYNYYRSNSRFIFGSLSQYQTIFTNFGIYQDSICDYIIEQGLWNEYISALTIPSKIGVVLCALIKNARTFLDSLNKKIEVQSTVKILNESGDESVDLLIDDGNNQNVSVKISNFKAFDI